MKVEIIIKDSIFFDSIIKELKECGYMKFFLWNGADTLTWEVEDMSASPIFAGQYLYETFIKGGKVPSQIFDFVIDDELYLFEDEEDVSEYEEQLKGEGETDYDSEVLTTCDLANILRTMLRYVEESWDIQSDIRLANGYFEDVVATGLFTDAICRNATLKKGGRTRSVSSVKIN